MSSRSVPLSADYAEREEQVNALARQEVPTRFTVEQLMDEAARLTIEKILTEIEDALSGAYPRAQGTDHANRLRISAVWRVVNGTRKRMRT